MRQIIEALEARGQKIKSKDPYHSVYKAMKDSTEFRNHGGVDAGREL